MNRQGVKPYPCVCGKGYDTAAKLLCHKKRDHDKDTIGCGACHHTWKNTSDFYVHRKRASASPECKGTQYTRIKKDAQPSTSRARAETTRPTASTSSWMAPRPRVTLPLSNEGKNL